MNLPSVSRRAFVQGAAVGVAAAGGIGLINSVGNLGGFVAPYATGALSDLTGSEKAGMWAVGAVMLAAAGLVVALRATPDRGRPAGSTLGANPGGH